LPILKDETFINWISKRYAISNVDGIMQDEVTEQDIEEVYHHLEEV
jgi:hypothetical protein